eukprot:TRINITY_DN50170_c1_g1_i4.p2 TRINITY_DN50170_c1_g1~~TRINITY_DN50170_c1_g1_i4.p2  ORF type:complete len:346 (+),score=17.31 TRINITY_DN50170_c1_g1_i4:85-1122(+)
MAVSRTLMALGASGVLAGGALAAGPPRDYCPTNSGFSVRIGYGSGYSNYRHGHGSSYYRGSGSHYYGTRSRYGSGVSVHYNTRSRNYCPPPQRRVVYDHRPVYRETHVYRTPAAYCPPPRTVTVYGSDRAPKRVTIDQAWKQLGRGESRTALNSFSTLAEASPYKSLPKVGFALACAERGDLEGAIHAMRRAYATDADAIHYFPRDERLLRLVQDLEYRYIKRSEVAHGNPDYHFMIGALAFLRHDMERAWVAVCKAEDYRDRSKSTRALRKVVEKWRDTQVGLTCEPSNGAAGHVARSRLVSWFAIHQKEEDKQKQIERGKNKNRRKKGNKQGQNKKQKQKKKE